MIRALSSFAIACGAVLLATGLFTGHVDPYGYYGRAPYGQYDEGFAPEFKAASLGRYPHELTLIGTSKGMRIDPDDFPGCRMFNASINGIRAEQIRHLVEHFVPRGTHVVIALDFFTFRDEPPRSTAFGNPTPRNFMKYTLSTAAVVKSFNTLKQVGKGRPVQLKANGAKPTPREDYAARKRDYQSYFDFTEVVMFKDFRLSETRLKMIADTRELLARRGQPHTFYISPNSQPMLDFLGRLGLMDEYAEFRRRVRDIVPDAIDYTGEYLDPLLYFPNDPHHYLPSTAVDFINRIVAERGCNPSRTPGRPGAGGDAK
jgi:hypothetical protein